MTRLKYSTKIHPWCAFLSVYSSRCKKNPATVPLHCPKIRRHVDVCVLYIKIRHAQLHSSTVNQKETAERKTSGRLSPQWRNAPSHAADDWKQYGPTKKEVHKKGSPPLPNVRNGCTMMHVVRERLKDLYCRRIWTEMEILLPHHLPTWNLWMPITWNWFNNWNN